MTIEIDDRAEARLVLWDYEMTERAIDNAYQPIASSLMVDGRKGVEKLQGDRKDALKAFVQAHDNEAIEDGELGVTAKITVRSTTPQYDLITCANTESGAAALLEAAKAGLLRVDHKMLTDFRKRSGGASWADTIERYAMPAGATPAIHIERGR